MRQQKRIDFLVGLILTLVGGMLTGLGVGTLYATTDHHNTALLAATIGPVFIVLGLVIIFSSITED